MQQDWFCEWFLQKLGVNGDVVVYPPINRNGRRPDFRIVEGGSTVAWVEVELKKNETQARDYREAFEGDPIKTVWGRKSDGGNLSLEEIDAFLESRAPLTPQLAANAAHLRKLIDAGLERAKGFQTRTDATEMLKEPAIVALQDGFGDKLVKTSDGIHRGEIGADTNGPQGISLKVRRSTGPGIVAVFSITAGRSIIFPSRKKLMSRLPDKRNAIDQYMAFVQREFGNDINVDVDANNASPYLSLHEYRQKLIDVSGELARILLLLA